ncbi:MAG: Pirin [Cytophagales bacterium]|jgi:redox-sensitive bicupin YhaK (pirin superfamily)|nr:pirin family protein [Bacteroidota bacterium]MBS1979601.1 pirin family protein [Bacteroidota bacterium]WHZ09198.1 MAG: Pirin [Cytophagales bacterium]
MAIKNLERVITPSGKHYVGDGFLVHNIIPGSQGLSMQRISPFIMMDYNAPHYFSPSNTPKGVGVHPHRGFETVTIAYKGKVEHHDSSGGGGVIGEGDVQWMTAASGVLHKEFHEKEWSKKGGDFQMVQLWVNLPAKDKMSPPKYQSITQAQMGKYHLSNHGGVIEVIAGQYNGITGAASTFTPVHLLNVRMKTGGKAEFSFPNKYNTALLVLEGSITVNDKDTVPANNFALFKNDGETFFIEAIKNAIVLVLSGEPINEPIAHHGPFVMNTKEEIMQAFEDFNMGKFGYLE